MTKTQMQQSITLPGFVYYEYVNDLQSSSSTIFPFSAKIYNGLHSINRVRAATLQAVNLDVGYVFVASTTAADECGESTTVG